MKSPILLALLLIALAGGTAHSQAVVFEETALSEASGLPDTGFGGKVALLGERVLVGLADANRVQVFLRTGSQYVFEADLVPPDGVSGDWFGFSLAASGTRCVVGAPRHHQGVSNAGAAYVFAFDGSAWGFEQKLTASDREANDELGWSVGCSPDRIVIGARKADYPGQLDQGSAYVFDLVGPSWSETAILTGPDSVGGDWFGLEVDLEGELLIVGSRGNGSHAYSGAAYAFRDAGAGLVFEHKFVPTVPGETFAHQVDIDGDRVAMGMPYGGVTGAGVAYVFERTGGVWDSGFVCEVPYGGGLDQLGTDVALSGDWLVAGSIFDWTWGDWSGSASVFERSGSEWLPLYLLLPSDGRENQVFGQGVAFDGTRIAVGAPDWSGLMPSREAVYLYQPAPRVGTAVCAGDGSVTPCPCGNESDAGLDFGCENAYERGANLAGSGSASLGADDLVLSVEHLTHTSFVPAGGMYTQLIGGSSLLSGQTFGDGLRCVGGGLLRLGRPKLATSGGVAWWGPGLVSLGGWGAGETCFFQAWYRDTASGGCGHQSNTSNALAVTFVP